MDRPPPPAHLVRRAGNALLMTATVALVLMICLSWSRVVVTSRSSTTAAAWTEAPPFGHGAHIETTSAVQVPRELLPSPVLTQLDVVQRTCPAEPGMQHTKPWLLATAARRSITWAVPPVDREAKNVHFGPIAPLPAIARYRLSARRVGHESESPAARILERRLWQHRQQLAAARDAVPPTQAAWAGLQTNPLRRERTSISARPGCNSPLRSEDQPAKQSTDGGHLRRVQYLAPAGAARPAPVSLGAAPSRRAENPAFRSVLQVAQRHIQGGLVLAERGAVFSARREFVRALDLIAQALDTLERDTRHTEALARAARALDEADEFVASGSRLTGNLDLAQIVSAHRTPVLAGRDLAVLSPAAARAEYYTYAQIQLVTAAGGEPVASLALFALGKALAFDADGSDALTADAKGMVHLQAALLTERTNFLAANELGLLLARYGRYAEAREVFRTSATVSPQPATWHNLAAVHRHLGEHRLADLADNEEHLARAGGAKASAATGVVWLAPQDFASRRPPESQVQPPGQPDVVRQKSFWPFR